MTGEQGGTSLVLRDLCEIELPDAMTPEEADRLSELEAQVERDLTVIEDRLASIASALTEVHDRCLYRADHSTFAAYLKARWDRSRSWGYQLIDVGRVLDTVSTTVDISPNGRQARELAPLLRVEGGEALVIDTWRVLSEFSQEHGEELTHQIVRELVTAVRLGETRHETTGRLWDDGGASEGIRAAMKALKAEKRKPTADDRPPVEPLPGREAPLVPGQLNLDGCCPHCGHDWSQQEGAA